MRLMQIKKKIIEKLQHKMQEEAQIYQKRNKNNHKMTAIRLNNWKLEHVIIDLALKLDFINCI